MKSRINLYVSALHPIKEPLPLSMSLSIMGAVLSVMLIGCGTVYWLGSQQEMTNNQLNTLLATEQQTLAERAVVLGQMNNNKRLEADIALIQETIKNKKRILNAVDTQVTSGGGYSELLVALGEVSDGKVWLTQISSQQGALTLSGSALLSRDIPLWVGRLNKAVELQGQSFSSLTMQRDDRVVNFVLNNQQTEANAGVSP